MTEQRHGPRSEANEATSHSTPSADGCLAAANTNAPPAPATPGDNRVPHRIAADEGLAWNLWAEVQSVAVRWRSAHPDGPIPAIRPRPCPTPGGAANPGRLSSEAPISPAHDLLPFVLVRVFTMSSQPVPQTLRARLTWHDDPPQPWLAFDPHGYQPGNTWELTLPVDHPVPIGNYRYTVEVEALSPDGRIQRDHWSDWAGVAGEGLDNPFGWTQSTSEMDCLVPRPGGRVLVTGWGGIRYFARKPDGSYNGAPDAGTLVEHTDHTFTLTNPDQTARHFDAQGRPTRATDLHRRTTTYLFDRDNQLLLRTVDDSTETMVA